MKTETFQPPASVSGLQRFGTVAAVVGLLLAGVGFAIGGLERFYQAYLVAYTFWLGVALGSMALLMVQHLSGGANPPVEGIGQDDVWMCIHRGHELLQPSRVPSIVIAGPGEVFRVWIPPPGGVERLVGIADQTKTLLVALIRHP
jgi:hypothetical protein